jgi:hypothetical protein
VSSTLGKKQYLLLGKLLVMRHPEVADRLLVQIEQDPPEKDLSRIPELYNSFCALVNIDPSTFQGPLHQTHKVDIRRLFVSIILHLYNPQVYHHPNDSIFLRQGLTIALSTLLKINDGHMSRFIRETIMMEKVYEEYRQKVEQAMNGLTNKNSSHG